MGIQDAVAVALAANRDLQAAVSALLGVQGRAAEARAALNPTAGVTTSATEFDQATSVSLAGQSIPILAQFNPVVTAQIELPLDVAGLLRAARTQAGYAETAARIDINRTRNDVVLETKTAFYDCLRAQAQVRVAADNLDNILTRLDSAEKNFAAGVAPHFDIVTAQTDVADAQQSVIQARSRLSLSLAVLKNTLGLDSHTPLTVTDQGAVASPSGEAPGASSSDGAAFGIAEPTRTEAPVSLESAKDPQSLGAEYDGLLQEALRTRPEIAEAEANLAAARCGLRLSRRSSLPAASVGLGYTYMPNNSAFTRANQGAAMVSVTMPLFDGGVARARAQEAESGVALAETNRRSAIDQVGLDVQQAYLSLRQARARIRVAATGLVRAREAARLAQARYNAGVTQQMGISPILELSNAQTSLSVAGTNQVNSLYDYNSALAQLDRAVGRYSDVGAGPGYASPPRPDVVGFGRRAMRRGRRH